MTSRMGAALLGASTFCAKQHGADECDGKGLPLTPHSINIVGRFRILQGLSHPSLCAYLAIKRARSERLIVVSERYDDNIEKHIKSEVYNNVKVLRRLCFQVLGALAYLNDHGIVHCFLAPDTIMITPQGDAKLHNYGLYYMTDSGRAVQFPIGSPRYMAPEVIMAGRDSHTLNSPKVDVWSLGMILLELFMGTPVYPDLSLQNGLSPLLKRLILLTHNYHQKGIHPLTALLKQHNCTEKPMNSDLCSLLEACLSPQPSNRPTPKELLSHPFIENMAREGMPQNGVTFAVLPSPFIHLTRCQSLSLDLPTHTLTTHPHTVTEDHLADRTIQEVYYLWSLAGGDVEMEMKKNGLIKSTPPICSLPCLITNEGEEYGVEKNCVSLYDSTVLPLSLDQLRMRLEGMTTIDYYPLVINDHRGEGGVVQGGGDRHASYTLPLAIKERDVEYQFHRMIIFTRLLESYPYSREHITAEAIVDVCPFVRADVWAALLGVKGDIQTEYTAIDKESESVTDRQIAVDIPRCHQYSPLLASQEGHKKFRRIIKAWIRSHTHLVYWQGLDSLCAPFLALNFNNEALAYACLKEFISKYLYNFFLKDNSPIMQEYLAVFSQMIAFHEPELFNHLDSIAFHTDLYAIPWFLTQFTHILPLNKIYYLWDTLLLGNASFPIFVGVSILQHLKDDLLSFDFNDCILMFSDMPDIDIEGRIHDAVTAYQRTPPSTYHRKHDHTPRPSLPIPPETIREPLPLAVLKQESCPHISAHDLVILCQLQYQALGYGGKAGEDDFTHTHTTMSPLMRRRDEGRGGRSKRSPEKAVIVDIRSLEEFRLGHVPDSISLPHTSAFQPDGSLSPSPSSSTLSSLRGKAVVIVVANKGESGPIFSRQLVRLNYRSVCVLQNGAGVLRSLGLLSSLRDDP